MIDQHFAQRDYFLPEGVSSEEIIAYVFNRKPDFKHILEMTAGDQCVTVTSTVSLNTEMLALQRQLGLFRNLVELPLFTLLRATHTVPTMDSDPKLITREVLDSFP